MENTRFACIEALINTCELYMDWIGQLIDHITIWRVNCDKYTACGLYVNLISSSHNCHEDPLWYWWKLHVPHDVGLVHQSSIFLLSRPPN